MGPLQKKCVKSPPIPHLCPRWGRWGKQLIGALQCSASHSSFELAILSFFNARRMRTRVTVVCLSVCLFVCYRSTACVGHLCNKMNVPANFVPNSKGFQLRDFAKKLSLTSYSLFFVFGIAKSAIFQFPV